MQDFKIFQTWLRQELKYGCEFDNLGGRSKGFRAQFNDNDSLRIKVISKGTIYNVSWEHIERCYRRCESLCGKEKFQTSSYEIQKWKDCPDKITMPYVAKLIKEFMECKRIET